MAVNADTICCGWPEAEKDQRQCSVKISHVMDDCTYDADNFDECVRKIIEKQACGKVLKKDTHPVVAQPACDGVVD